MFATRAATRVTEEGARSLRQVGTTGAEQMMWLSVSPLLYRIARVWNQPHRSPKDDPMLFMLKDRIRVHAGARFLAVLWAAT